MFSRNVTFELQAKSAAEFTSILGGLVIPLLRRPRGFEDGISFIAPERNEAVAVSLWDKKEDAEAYDRKIYPDVLKFLSCVLEGFQSGNLRGQQLHLAPDRRSRRQLDNRWGVEAQFLDRFDPLPPIYPLGGMKMSGM